MEVVYWGNRYEKFVSGLDSKTFLQVSDVICALEEYGHLLGMPDSKSLGKGLFELRVQGKIKIRILYIFHNNRSYIVHGFIKKTWKIPLHDIQYARQIQKEILRLALYNI